MLKLLVLFILFFSFDAHTLNYYPNKKITTGSFCKSNFIEFREIRYVDKIAICFRRVSKSKRNKIYKLYSISNNEKILYTIDHYIPLFMGGSNNLNNLWPQPRIISSARLEQKIYYMLRSNRINKLEAMWFMKDKKDSK